ncbi:MAG: restriction endonuclease subunit S [Sulfitobacter sp.]|uniref:restriction endonuclease subunit S n=1 Tax=Alphaproteobacteria TaxID=28211 RepID=UPI003263F87F
MMDGSSPKATPMLVTPSEWSENSFYDLAKITSGQVDPRKAPYNSMILVAPDHIRTGSGRIDQRLTAIQQGAISGKYLVKKGEVIYSKIRPNLQKLALADEDCLCSADMYPVAAKEGVSALFLKYLMLSAPFTEFATSVSVRSGMPKINRQELAHFSAVVPDSYEEQEAIAEALSDADALIEELERLILKKRLIKQGAMQSLLTAERRLPGFSGEWKRYRLSEIGEVTGSGVDKKIVEGEQPIRLLNYTDVYREQYITGRILHHWVTASEQKARRCRIRNGDIFFTPTSETPDDIARSAVALEDIEDAAYSYHVVKLRLNKVDSRDFWAHIFETEDFRRQARLNADGSGTRYVVTLRKFRNMEISIPNETEREAIGETLRDMSAEIHALVTRLEKARQVKDGMMQNLLTGRIRLD